MYVFIDESGCSGFKLDRGSTPFFVTVMVILADRAAVDRAAAAVQAVRAETNHKPEFKFSKCSNSLRDTFFDRLCREDFTVRAIVVDKAKVYSPHLRDVAEDFYRYFVQLLMKHDNGALSNARVRIDGSGNRDFQRELGSYLREQVGPGKLHSVKMKDSSSSELIQLADMCAGAIHRRYKHQDAKADAARWYKKLGPRIGDLWTFPNN